MNGPPDDEAGNHPAGKAGGTQPLEPIEDEQPEDVSTHTHPPAAVLREGAKRPAQPPPRRDETGRVRPVPGSSPPAAWRVILQTLHPGTSRIGLNVWSELVIGRLDDPSKPAEAPDLDMSPHRAEALGVSRRHAALIPGTRALFLVDLHSTNGTWVNGTYLPPGQQHPLKPGDRIELGLLRLAVRSLTILKRPSG